MCIIFQAGNDGTCCYNNSAGSQNTCTMIGHRSIINSLDIKIHNDSELQAPETPSASEGDSTNPYAGFNSEKLQFLVASSLVEDNQEEQFKAVGGIHGLFSDIQKYVTVIFIFVSTRNYDDANKFYLATIGSNLL